MKRYNCVIGILLLGFIQNSFAQDLDIINVGTRALGMGGAYIGIAEDVTALFWNPAGLIKIENPEAIYIRQSNSNTHEPSFYLKDYRFTINRTTDFENKYTSFMGVAYPLKQFSKRATVAVAFHRQLDFYDDYHYIFNAYKSERGVYTINPGVGFEIMPSLSMGITGNIWRGSHEFELDYYQDIYEEYRWLNERIDYDLSGYNITAGLMFDMSKTRLRVPVNAGMIIRSPFSLKGDYHYLYHLIESSEFGEWKGTVDIEMPLMIGTGISYKTGKYITLSSDFEQRRYGDKKFKFIAPEDSMSSEVKITRAEKNLNQIRSGIEILVPWETFYIPLRAGFCTLPKLVSNERDYEWADTVYTPVTGTQFAFGTGFNTRRIKFSMTILFSRYDTVWEDKDYREDVSWRKKSVISSATFYFR